MKTFVLLLAASCVAVAVAKPGQYTTKYDNVDLDEILKSDRLLKNYTNCLLDKGHCTPDGSELKKVVPDALQTGCSKCNENQKSGTRKIIDYLIKNKQDVWKQLQDKYDSKGIYLQKYHDQL
ncbi:unnamed protein product [Brassicogethes aeneus]|uniref:Chemosensory protein n=1 Tax=Brassicogethes aeneus TaxID=1431903 RepID=A0A9P0AXH4_BRAAE|nr:unnamed protein product [Brassicogethes aeneus]